MILVAINEPDEPLNVLGQHREALQAPILTINELGPQLWEELHCKEDATEDWFLKDWLSRVPRYCGCQEKVQQILERFKPKYGKEWFRFTVDLHNAVNAALVGKPQFSYDEAEVRWGRKIDRTECDQCGLCCREYVITPITEQDLTREPRLSKLLPIIMDNRKGCPLQLESGACGIYETRPDVCRRYSAGSVWCNALRVNAGLGPL